MKKDYIITLEDGKEYALVNALIIDNKKYVYLVDIHDYSNIIFGEFVADRIDKVTDNELLSKLIVEFAKLKEGEE